MKFKMVCFSARCCGSRVTANGVTKYEDKLIRDCPDCGHALFKDTGGNGKIKDQKKVERPSAEFGFKSTNKYDIGV